MKKVLVALLLMIAPANAQQITPQQAQALAKMGIEFLGRTDLKGNETDAMFQVRLMLNAIATGTLTVEAPKPPAEPTAPAKK